MPDMTQTTTQGVSVRAGRDGGSIVIRFRWQDQDRRETLNMKPTRANLNYAARLREAIERDIRAGGFDYSAYFPNSVVVKKEELQVVVEQAKSEKREGTAFAELGQRWLGTLNNMSVQTRRCHKRYVSILNGLIGDVLVEKVRHSELALLMSEYDAMSDGEYNRTIRALKRMFDMACTDGVIINNPAAPLKLRRIDKKEPNPLAVEDINRILGYFERHHQQVRNFFQFAFYSGLRAGELRGLRWDRVDWGEGQVYVCCQRGEYGIRDYTKTGRNRYVDLNPKSLEALVNQREHTLSDGEYVFYNPETRRPWHKRGDAIRSLWHAALSDLNIKDRRVYETRHAYATILLMSGCKIPYAADQLGHSVQMFLNVYSRWINKTEVNRERDRVADFLG